jgi:hypothetical protein
MVIGPTLPLYMGRAFFGLLYVRTGHDPLAFAVGCTMVLLFKNWAQVHRLFLRLLAMCFTLRIIKSGESYDIRPRFVWALGKYDRL